MFDINKILFALFEIFIYICENVKVCGQADSFKVLKRKKFQQLWGIVQMISISYYVDELRIMRSYILFPLIALLWNLVSATG